MPGEYPRDPDVEPPRKPSVFGGHPKRALRKPASGEDEEEEDDSDKPRPSQQKGNARRGGRGGRSQLVPRRAGSDNDDDDDDGDSRPPPRSANARRGGRAGRPQPAIRHKKSISEDDAAENDDADSRRPPPRRKTAKARAPKPDDDDDNQDPKSSPPAARQPTNPAFHRREPSPVRFSPIEPDDVPPEDMDDQFRRALALSLQEPPPTRSPAVDDEEQMRLAMEASMADAAAQRAVPNNSDEDPDIRRLIEFTEKEHKLQERERGRREREEAQKFEADVERAVRASERAAQRSGHFGDQNKILSVIRESQETHNDGVQRAAERMALERDRTQRSASWTETNINSGKREGASLSTMLPQHQC